VRSIGLHLRLHKELCDVAGRAMALKLPFFQCFLRPMGSKGPIFFTRRDVALFLRDYRPAFNELYLHGSYWINLASISRTKHHVLHKELYWAKKLQFTHLILHPGSAKGALHRDEGVDALVIALNTLLKKEHDIKIVLENTAHGNMSVGSDITDFAQVLQKLDHPDRVLFCIDTAHAYAYGYNIRNPEGQDAFIALLDKTIGIKRIALLHVNDTHEQLGSCLDRHHMLGDGQIGHEALKRFVLHPQLYAIPMLMEPPIASFEQEHGMLNAVLSWHTQNKE
jgi:deoxyribonuclease-4